MKKIFIFFVMVFNTNNTYAQVVNGLSFGIKGGLNNMSTQLIKQPRNSTLNLSGIRARNGYQIGIWCNSPINRWIFSEVDWGFQQKGHELFDPSKKDIVIASNKYNYMELSARVGVNYKGAFISLGPEANILINDDVQAWHEASSIEWGVNTRIGYQYKRFRLEMIYNKGINHYEQKTWDTKGDFKTLFYGNTIGVSLGIKLFERDGIK